MKYVLFFYISTFCGVCVCVCSAKYDCCLYLLDFMLSWYIAQVLSELFWNGSNRPIITGITFAVTFLTEYLLWRLYILKSYQLLSWSHFSFQELQHLLTSMFYFIIMDYDVWFIVRNSSVSSHLLVPQYGSLISMTCFTWFWYMIIPVFVY